MRINQGLLTGACLLASSCLFSTGCQTTDNSNAVAGGVFGAGLGAITGAVIGAATGHHNAAAGALIGAAAGGVGGSLLGHSQDEKNQQVSDAAHAQYQQAQAAAEQAALTNADVIYMVRSGMSEPVIVNSIKSRGGRFNTTPDELVQLKASGCSDYLIQVMQSTPPPSVRVVAPAVYGPEGPAVGIVVAPRPYYYGGYYGYRRW